MFNTTNVSSLNGSDMPQQYDDIADDLSVADMGTGTHTIVVLDAATGLPKRIASSVPLEDDEPVTCFYDKPCFIGEGFGRAAASIDFWVAMQAKENRPVTKRFADAPVESKAADRLRDLHMYTSPFATDFMENYTAHICLQEVLADTVGEVYDLPEAERGHYLAQLTTRWFSDGTIDPLRFRLANVLARYYAMMPRQAGKTEPMGLYKVNDDLEVHGWLTAHGIFFDLAHVFKQEDVHIQDDIAAALAYGRELFDGGIAGVRYLPLENLNKARLYESDGTYTEVLQRDLLGEDLWGDESDESPAEGVA